MQQGPVQTKAHWLARRRPGPPQLSAPAFFAVLTIAYTLFAYIGLNWAVVAGAGSPVWPASGIALAGLLIGGLRFWPAILVGRVAAAVLSGSQQPLWADTMIGFANVLGTIAPILVIRQLGGIDTRLQSVQDVARYLFGGAALGAVIAAFIGTSTLHFSSGVPMEHLPSLMTNWAIGNFAGAVTLGPLIMSWSDRTRPLNWDQRLHLAALVVTALIAAAVVFLGSSDEPLQTWHLLPILVWAALAFDVRGASLVMFIVSALAVWATSRGYGPLIGQMSAEAQSIPLLQQFIAVTALTTLFLATIADERRAREAMRAREERLRVAIEASGAGTFRWQIRDDRLDCDEAMLQLLRLEGRRTPAQLEDLIALFHPDDRTMALRAFDACLRGGSDFALAVRLGDHGDAARILQARGRLVTDGQGLPDYLTGAFVDVTERSRLERRLQKAEETYRAVFEQAGVGVARLTLDGAILEVNDRFAEIIGRPLKDLLGDNWRTLALADDHRATQDQMDWLLHREGKSRRIEKRYDLPDGDIVWVDESMTLVRDQLGAPAFFLAFVQDIQERKLAEDEVRVRAEELEAVLSAVPAAIWFGHDPACLEITGNVFSAEILRLSGPGVNMSKSVPNPSPVAHFRVFDRDGKELAPNDLPVQRAARGELIRNFEERVTFNDGSSVYLLGNARPLMNAQGKIRGAVAAFIDITDRKRAEAREQLLTREVDHRAKNVLAVVQAIVQLTQADSVGTFRRMVAGRIQSLARTHNLLAENRWEGVDLQRLLSDELAPFGMTEAAQIDASRFDLAGPMIRLKPAAAQALALVIHELLTNAVKYGALSSPEGRVAVHWALTQQADASRLVLQWVEQGGPAVVVPDTSGFGWTVIRTSVEDQLNGQLATDWGVQGLRVTMDVPLAEIGDLLS